ncbi:MAG: ATP-dependent helicase [Armatimonadota bacterium]|nr:ATP-dependent helicase [Armatimonadota bacterium]
MKWDDGLDGVTKNIAETPCSPLRVIAGPGTGKTFALVRRVAKLIQNDNISPDKILVCTFTRTAAADLKSELSKLGIEGVEKVYAGTLHALCFSMLNRSEVLEITGRHPRPLLQFEERFLQEDLKARHGDLREVINKIQAFNAAWARLQHEMPGWPESEEDKRFSDDLSDWLRFHEAMLIGELIPEALRYIRDNPKCPERDKFDHVLVDEYQDLNRAEQSILDLLSENGSLTVVGDEDQSIYSFKYAHPDGIASFEENHPGTKTISLNGCRRCPDQIVMMANSLISNNKSRIQRSLEKNSTCNSQGEVYVVQWQSMDEEAEGIAQFVETRIASGKVEPGGVLILAPRRDLGYAIRNSINHKGIPAHSFFSEEAFDGSPQKLEESKSQQMFTLLTLLAEPDDRVALRCWCGFGSKNLASKQWSRLREYCRKNGKSPREALDALNKGNLQLSNTGYLLERYRELVDFKTQMGDLYGADLLDALFPAENAWSEPFRSFASVIDEADYDASTLLDALRTNLIQPELPTNVDYVRVMSLHKSKGLTADLVVVAGCVEGLIPSETNNAKTDEEKQHFLEEQRRLFYVAITRSRNTLILSSVTCLPVKLAYKMGVRVQRKRKEYAYTVTSRFIGELGPSCPKPIKGEEFLKWTTSTSNG